MQRLSSRFESCPLVHCIGTVLLLLTVCFCLPGRGMADNRLAEARSPYLRHHAGDPIQWQPWGEEALALARRLDRPIFLSIGYLACHWCGVMGQETFQDAEVARELNDHFIPILVDREERPDLDAYYLKVAEGMNEGRSGWPQTLFLTPDLLPLFAGNYYPPVPREGLPGFRAILSGLRQAWTEQRAALLAQEPQIRAQLRAMLPQAAASPDAEGETDLREEASRFLLERVDASQGGFQERPKFFHPAALSLLLREGVRRHAAELLAPVYATLDRMAAGGVRDQLGGLFHRYAVDRFWHTPHYEILLADNALLARLYLEGYQVSHDARYAQVAREILDGLLDRLLLPDGGMASSLAADSRDRAGVLREGAYYTWTLDEVKAVLGPVPTRKWSRFLALGDGEEGGALHLRGDPKHLLTVQHRLAPAMRRLAEARRQRPPPARDDQAITAWNGLAVSALTLAARVLEEPRYQQAALAMVEPILAHFRQTGRLSHIRWEGEWSGGAFLDDYACLVQALLDLYETDFRLIHLDAAWQVAQTLLARFGSDGEEGILLSMTPTGESGPLPVQRLVWDQQGIPSGNAVAWSGLARLNRWRADPVWRERLAQVVRQLPAVTGQSPHQAGDLLRILDDAPLVARDVIIVGDRADPMVVAMLRMVRHRLGVGVGEGVAVVDSEAECPDWPTLGGRAAVNGQPTAYVCQGGVCLKPVTDGAGLQKLLGK